MSRTKLTIMSTKAEPAFTITGFQIIKSQTSFKDHEYSQAFFFFYLLFMLQSELSRVNLFSLKLLICCFFLVFNTFKQF